MVMGFSKMQMSRTLSQLWNIVFGTFCWTHTLISHKTLITLYAAPAQQIYIFLFLPLLYFSHRHTRTHTHTASYTTVIVDRKFMAHSSVPGVPDPLKYPPPPTITAHSNQPKLQQSGAWETLMSAIFLQSSCGGGY